MNMETFNTGNQREHIAHLLAEAQRAILSLDEPVSSVDKQIRAASLLLSQIIEETPKTGDYELARAKRQFERLLRDEGYAKDEAMQIVYDHFKNV